MLRPKTVGKREKPKAALLAAVQVATNDLPLLVTAGPAERTTLFQRIVKLSHPIVVIFVAFQEYDRTQRESYLLHALSLLEAWGPAASPSAPFGLLRRNDRNLGY